MALQGICPLTKATNFYSGKRCIDLGLFKTNLYVLQVKREAEERAAKAEHDLEEANDNSHYELKNQIRDLESQLRDKEVSHQNMLEEQSTLHQQIQSAKVALDVSPPQ